MGQAYTGCSSQSSTVASLKEAANSHNRYIFCASKVIPTNVQLMYI